MRGDMGVGEAGRSVAKSPPATSRRVARRYQPLPMRPLGRSHSPALPRIGGFGGVSPPIKELGCGVLRTPPDRAARVAEAGESPPGGACYCKRRAGHSARLMPGTLAGLGAASPKMMDLGRPKQRAGAAPPLHIALSRVGLA